MPGFCFSVFWSCCQRNIQQGSMIFTGIQKPGSVSRNIQVLLTSWFFLYFCWSVNNTHSKKGPWIYPFMAVIFQKTLKNKADIWVFYMSISKESCLSLQYERISKQRWLLKPWYVIVLKLCTIKSQTSASCLVAPNKDFQTAYEGKIWCLFTVIFWKKLDFWNNSPLYFGNSITIVAFGVLFVST